MPGIFRGLQGEIAKLKLLEEILREIWRLKERESVGREVDMRGKEDLDKGCCEQVPIPFMY